MAAGSGNLDDIRGHVAAADWQAAQTACRALLAHEPNHLEALHLLAGVLCERGEYSEAAAAMKQFVESQLPSPPTLRNLAYIYRRAEMHAETAATYAEICRLDPTDAASLNFLGIARLGTEEYDAATEAFEAAAKLLPQHAGVRRNVADAQRRAGRYAEAFTNYERTLQLAPDDNEARLGLARSAVQLRRFAPAVAAFERLLLGGADRGNIRGELAAALCSAARFDDAERHARLAIVEFRDDPQGCLALGNVQRERNQYSEAVVSYQLAIARDANHAGARYNLGLVYTELGDFAAAVEELERCIGLNPRFTAAYYLLGDLASQEKFRFTEEQLAMVRDLIGDGTLVGDAATALGFTLGGVLEKRGHYDEAFATYQAANDRKHEVVLQRGQAFDTVRYHENIERIIAAWNAEYFACSRGSGLETEVLTFVVGMPRSGTTLVEQILAAHPQAAGVGELNEIANLSGALRRRQGVDDGVAERPADVPQELFAELAEQYLATITGRVGAESHTLKRIVDKTPGNSSYLGLIASLFPKARIIVCRRDVRDICLSCYFRNLIALDWTWRLEDIGQVYNGYIRLLAHWHDVLPLNISVVDYERLIREPEHTTRTLLEFCGLPWDDACLEFYKGGQAVRTASRVQVRQPIYDTSVGRWQNYSSHLAELNRVLEQK